MPLINRKLTVCGTASSIAQHKQPPAYRMREVSPPRKFSFSHNRKVKGLKELAPRGSVSKRASARAVLPLQVVRPADCAVEKIVRHVFVDYRQPPGAQGPRHFVQNSFHILRVVEHITGKHCVKRTRSGRKMTPVIRLIGDARGSA
jgi:hypothetical protein